MTRPSAAVRAALLSGGFAVALALAGAPAAAQGAPEKPASDSMPPAAAPDATPAPPAPDSVSPPPSAPESAPPPAASPPPQTFKSWIAQCPPDGPCRAGTLSKSGLEAIVVSRAPGADSYALSFETRGPLADPERPITWRVDPGGVATLRPRSDFSALVKPESYFLVNDRSAAAIFSRLLKGRTARIEYLDVTGAPHDADFALDGLVDALKFVEGRLGADAKTRVAKGAKGLAPAPPVDKARLVAGLGLPPPLVERHRMVSDCEDPNSALLSRIAPVIGPLSKTATLYGVPCAASGDDVSYRLYVVESGEIGGIEPLFFAVYAGPLGWRGTAILKNISYDGEKQTLVHRARDRSETDCGGYGVWRWRDFAFAMQEFRYAPSCEAGRDPAGWRQVFPAG